MSSKKIFLIISIFLIIVICISFKTFFASNHNYVVQVKKIDDNSPDKMIEVYKDNELVQFKEIRFLNNTSLCTCENNAIFYGELENVNDVMIVFENSIINAKTEKEDL